MNLPDLIHELKLLCMCEEMIPAEVPCIYCDAREQIEAQQRTIGLLQDLLPKRDGQHPNPQQFSSTEEKLK